MRKVTPVIVQEVCITAPTVFVTGTGQRLVGMHEPVEECMKFGCVIHNPSDHHMKTWPTSYRGDRVPAIFERICKHGVGHPDPDDAASLERRIPDAKAVAAVLIHGCCGCCQPPE